MRPGGDFASRTGIATGEARNPPKYHRLFAGIRFEESDGALLYVYAKDEQIAAEIEDDFSLRIATVAAAILKQAVEVVVVMPKVLN